MKLEVKTFDETGLPRRIINLTYDNNWIKRHFLDSLIEKALNTSDIEVILGPRQCGKTTLIKQIIHELQNTNGVSREQIIYVNLDSLADNSLFGSPATFSDKINIFQNIDKKIYLFIDEIQRIDNPGLFLKGLFDLELNIKIIVSGSSSLEIRSKLKEFLTGRKKETHLYPLSLSEWFAYNYDDFYGRFSQNNLKADDILKQLENFDNIYGAGLKQCFWDMAVFGGYPKVIKNTSNRFSELEELYNSYVKKDVVEFMKVERPELFNNLVKTLAHQIGNLMNFSELCSFLGGNLTTLKRYVDILTNTYVINPLPPLVGNKRNEIKQMHKLYFIDCGIRNFVAGDLNLDTVSRSGAMIENALCSEMIKVLQKKYTLYFWRTKTGTEVDFVIDVGGGSLIPIEVKMGPAKIGQLTKSFHSFINSYKPERAIFANVSTIGRYTFGTTDVYYLPYYWIPIVDGIWQLR